MEKTIRHALRREQFEHVVVISATRSMGYPLKLIASPLNSITHFFYRHRAKYLTADAAIRRFGHYAGQLEAKHVAGKAAFVFCSSGTSNKGVANQIGMSDEAMIAMFRNALAFNENGNPFCEGTTSYCQLPPFVCTGFFVLVLAPLYRGMTVYLDPRPNVRQFAKNILAFRPQTTLATGASWVYLIDQIDRLIQSGQRPDLSFFRFPVMGGEGCTPQALRHINEVMEACGSTVALTSGYGLSETFSVCTVDYEPAGFNKDYSRHAVCVGAPFPGVTVGIFDEKDNELDRNQRGEIRVKTRSLTVGYINNHELNQTKLHGGWLHTNDLGELDSNGKLYIYGRMAQYIQAPDGEKVYLFDIANEIRQDPAVKESLACIPEDAPGQQIAVHLAIEPGNTESAEQIILRLDKQVSKILPAGIRIDGYKIEHGLLRHNMVGKTDYHYYRQMTTGFVRPENGRLINVTLG
jgi:acyl-CoA synthetase (AMP-forming)/AMP-acid ligase II